MDTSLLSKLYMNTTNELLFLLDVEYEVSYKFRFQSFNPAYAGVTGLNEASVGMLLGDEVSERSAAVCVDRCLEAVEKKQPVKYEVEAILSGNKMYIETTLYPFFDPAGRPTHLLGTIRDITDRKISEQFIRESEDRYRTLVQLSPDAILIIDEGRIVFNNDAAAKMLEVGHADELLGRNFYEFVLEDDQRLFKLYMQRMHAYPSEDIPRFETVIRKNTGETVDVEGASAFVEYNNKKVLQVVLRDITKRNQEKAQLERLSQLDGLTNVANRRHFDLILQREVNRARRNKHQLALILFDIDDFKQFNDHYGHLSGDDCLKRITSEAKLILKRPGDLLARFGGEEFAVLLPETDLYGAETVAEQLRKHIEQLEIPHAKSEVADVVTISLGVSNMIRPSTNEIIPMIERADKALYHAKRMGKNRVVAFPAP